MSICRNLYRGTVPGAATVLYTAPKAKRSIVKNVRAVNTSGAPVTLSLDIEGTLFVNGESISAGDVFEVKTFLVMDSEDELNGSCSSGGDIDIHIDGAEVL